MRKSVKSVIATEAALATAQGVWLKTLFSANAFHVFDAMGHGMRLMVPRW